MTQDSELIKIAKLAAQAGAKIIKKQFGKQQNTSIKNISNTLVTDTDLAAENAILKILRENSDFGIISEEVGTTGNQEGPQWVVDPLDGTSNFARSLPLFAVSIGLINGSESWAGVMVDPIQQKEYFAEKGEGAFCNNRKLILPKFKKQWPSGIFLNHGSGVEDKNKCAEINQRLSSDFSIRKFGTTSLELFYLANCSFDAFICSGDEIWDYAAGISITTEAGIILTDWKGNAWDGKENHLLFARPEIHQRLVEKIKDLQ